MKYIGWFIFDFVFVYVIYYIMFVRNSNKKEKMPAEARYLVTAYNLDLKKFSYRKFLYVISLVSSLDIALIAVVLTVVNGLVWQLIFGILAVLPVAVISFLLLGNYYKKKQNKDNSKELEREKKYLEKKKAKELKKKEKKKNKQDKKGTKKNVK